MRSERVYDLYAAALECNRDEFEALGRSLHRGASKGQRTEISRFHSNPEGQWVWGRPARDAPARDAPARGGLRRCSASWLLAAHCAARPAPRIPSLAGRPAKSLSRREEIVNRF